MKKLYLVSACLFLSACDLFTIRVNGRVQGGSQTATDPNQPSQNAYAENGKSSHGHGKNRVKDEDPVKALKATVEEARRDTGVLVHNIDEHLRKTSEPVSDQDLASLEAKRQVFADTHSADQVAYLEELGTYYQLENAWRGDATKSAEFAAKTLGGAVTMQGELTGKDKPAVFSFRAEAGNCYTMISHLKNAGGDDDHANSFVFDGGKETSALERYSIHWRRNPGSGLVTPVSKTYIHGFCATKSADVNASVTLSYAGSSNGLRYVVVEHARDKFPTYLANEAAAELTDSCDVDNWELLFTKPIPGGVVYGSSEPLVIYDNPNPEELWMTAWTANGQEARVQRTGVSSAAPSFKFPKEAHFRGCPKKVQDAHSAAGLKVAQCWEALDRRFQPQFDAANSARDNAVGYFAQAAAERRQSALNDQYSAEADRTCEKMNQDVGKKFEATYNRLVDFYQAAPYKLPFDRGAKLAATYKGSDLR